MRDFKKNKPIFKILASLIILIMVAGLVVAVKRFFPFRSAEKPYQTLSPIYYTEPMVVTRDNLSLTITPLTGEKVRVATEDKQTIYRRAYPKTDVVQTNNDHRLKEELLFEEPGHPTEFQYRLGNIEQFVIEKRQGDFIFYDKKRYLDNKEMALIFTMPAPFVTEFEGEPNFEAVAAFIEGDILTVRLDKNWLAQAKYPVILDPTVEINILNVYSHPKQGEEWVVDFTTLGTADLKIIPNDQATIDDDEFVSLTCDGENRTPQILAGDIIYYPNWQCAGTGTVIHKTLVAGKHTLRFEFSDPLEPSNTQIVYAYNDPADPWWNVSWPYRKEIIIYANQVFYTGAFPVMVTTTDADLIYGGSGHMGKSDGSDMAFTDDQGNALDYDLESYNNSTGQVVAWVEANVSASANTSIYIYYGNAGAVSQENEVGAWDTNYKGVWHMSETTGQHQDSTGVNDSTTVSVTTQGSASGRVGGADDFDGTDDYVAIGDNNSLDITNAGTIEAWISTDDVSTAEANFSRWKSITAPNGAGTYEQSSVDFVVVGDKIYYAALMCTGTTEDFLVASSDLNGDNFSGWNASQPVFSDGCGADEGLSVAIDSDGDFLYYGALGNLNGTSYFYTATTTLAGAMDASGWRTQSAPGGTGSGENSGIDMIIVGDKAYFAALTLNAGTETFKTASGVISNMDTNSISWTTQSNIPGGGGTNGNCNIGLDSDGAMLYYGAFCHTGTDDTYSFATSTLAGAGSTTGVGLWTYISEPNGTGTDDINGTDITIAGNRAYHAAFSAAAGTELYSTANTDLAGAGISWTSRQDASSNPNGQGTGDSTDASVKTDGKRLYYTAFTHSGATEVFFLASSTIPAHPIIAKNSAYELMQTGGGYIFDWAGRPQSFATATAVSTFTHVAVTHDGTTMNYYENGELKRTQKVTTDFVSNANNLIFGRNERGDGAYQYFNGIIDEIRISNTARSAVWLQTQYNNITEESGNFLDFGAEETVPENQEPGLDLTVDTPDPTNPGRSVSFIVNWSDVDSTQVKIKVCKTDSLTNQNCDGGFWASSTALTVNNPATVFYDVIAEDAGQTRNYWVFVCDISGDCSSSSSGTFTVNKTSVVPNVLFR